MKKRNLLIAFAAFGLMLQVVVSIDAQPISSVRQRCNADRLSPIRCGYFEEGYQDGLRDARRNRSNNYRRYRSKYESQYESYYRDGYRLGYGNTQSSVRWTDQQKNAYDQGFDDGRNDRNRRISRLPARYEGQFDRNYTAYYRKGYFDGYDNRQRQYDTLTGNRQATAGSINNSRIRRGRGTSTGVLNWSGRVDNRVNLIIQRGTVRVDTVAGRSFGSGSQNLAGVLPRRQAVLTVTKLDGRGTVRVLQQPNRSNSYTAIVEISDPRRGSDNYRLRANWQAVNTQEQYSSGKLTWRGRVDGTVSITIAGEDVESEDKTASGLSGVSFDLEGYLARRAGTVSVRKRDGRGSVRVIEQPSRRNGYVAVIQIFDPRGGADQYEIEVTW